MADSAKTKTYSDYFKDPRWQKKRLEVMERDDFTCQSCGSKEKTLNIHHTYYEKGKKPWEYPTESLITWCEKCHKYRSENKNRINEFIDRLDIWHFNSLIRFFYNEEGGAHILDAIEVNSHFHINYRSVSDFILALGAAYENGMTDEAERHDEEG